MSCPDDHGEDEDGDEGDGGDEVVAVVLDVVQAHHVLHSRHHGGGAGPGRGRQQRAVDALHDDLLQASLLPHVRDEGVCVDLILQTFVVELLNNLLNCGPGFRMNQ